MHSAIWVGLALAFNGLIYFWRGGEPALEFFTGYLIEKSLSIDNLFAFMTLFVFFKVSVVDQHRVLFWGIVGALVFRLTLILAGVALIEKFAWITYFLGIFLVGTGIKLGFEWKKKGGVEQSWLIGLCQRFFPLARHNRGDRFFTRENGKWKMTSLCVVLIAIEATDVLFAIDSIPAIFAITTDPFIVYTSNVFAILGLRSLYFALVHFLGKLKYLKIGLGALLVLIGAKMVFSKFYPISLPLTLSLVVLILLITVWSSWNKAKRNLSQ
jgi:tellurite resistance protein TerC